MTDIQFEILTIAGGMMGEGCNKEEVVAYLAIMGYDPADIRWWCKA